MSMHDELGLFVFGFRRELEAVDLCSRCFDLSCDLEWFYVPWAMIGSSGNR